MFDVGFWEITVIAIVALLVIGPERLPAVARTVGMWFGKIRAFVSSVQTDINREINKSEELKRLLEEQSKIKASHDIIEKTIGDIGQPIPRSASIAKQDEEQKPAQPTAGASGDVPVKQDSENSGALQDDTKSEQHPAIDSTVNEQPKR